MSDFVLQATIHDEPIPLEWEVSVIDREKITIVRVSQPKGDPKYKVMKFGQGLSIYGDWDHEPMPSSRDQTYYDNHRFDQFSRAWEMAKKASEEFVTLMQKQVDQLNAKRRERSG